MTPPTTCTIIARNYLAHARVIARSFTDQHPGQRLQVLLVDDVEEGTDAGGEPFDVVAPRDLPLTERTYHEMAMCYDVMELSTALKPTLLKLMLARSGGEPVLYLDPDVLVLAPLDEVAPLAREHSIVLTPHASAPMPRDGLRPSETEILASGVYNMGFVALAAGSEAFLDWWEVRLRRDAVVDHARMLFTDQRWIDLAVSCFEMHLLRDEGYNVAYWNADQRPVQRRDGRWYAGDRPLRFYHFSGFNPRAPHVLSKHQGSEPRVRLSEHPGILALSREYSRRLVEEGWEECRDLPSRWDTLPDGTTIDRRMRRAYRTGLLQSDATGAPPPPDAFDKASLVGLYDWYARPDPRHRSAPRLPRYLWEIYADREDLRRAYPHVGTIHETGFRDWLHDNGTVEVDVPPPLHPLVLGEIPWGAPPVAPAPPTELRSGIVVAGYLRAELGIGEAARLAIESVEAAGVRCASYSYGATVSRQRHPWRSPDTRSPDLDTNVVCVNPDQLAIFSLSVGPAFFDGRYTIGSWYWETERLPEAMAASRDLVDEIWVPSAYTAAAVRATIDDRPVHVFPHPIRVPDVDHSLRREDLGLPEGFVFFFVFDFLSSIARKNPVGLIDAFSRAFRPDEGATLVLKSINGHLRVLDAERVRLAAAERPDVVLLDRYADKAELGAMLALSDCYVSLHRAEGLGLTIADAIALGKPAIATGYSGNLDFMDAESSLLVPYTLTTVGPGVDEYPADARWADPDLDAAAEAMRRVHDHPEEALHAAARGRERVLRDHTPRRAGEFVAARFAAAQERRAAGYTSGVAGAVRRRMS